MENKYHEIDAILAARTIYPKAKKANRINKGYSHEIFEVETEAYPESVIVRFTNNNPDENSLGKEIRVNNLLQEIGIPVPRIILHDKSKTRCPYEFAILSKSEGKDLIDIWDNLSKKDQEDIAEQMGEILGKIHTIRFDSFGILKSEGISNKNDITDFSLRIKGKMPDVNRGMYHILSITMEDVGKLSSFNIIPDKTLNKISSYIIKNKDLCKNSDKPCLLHGDFEYRNIKVKKIKNKWNITALFDFEYSASRQKEYDFIKLDRIGFLANNHIRKGLIKGYTRHQKIDNEFDKKVKYFRMGRDIAYCVVLLKAGDKEMAIKILKSVEERIDNDFISQT